MAQEAYPITLRPTDSLYQSSNLSSTRADIMFWPIDSLQDEIRSFFVCLYIFFSSFLSCSCFLCSRWSFEDVPLSPFRVQQTTSKSTGLATYFTG